MAEVGEPASGTRTSATSSSSLQQDQVILFCDWVLGKLVKAQIKDVARVKPPKEVQPTRHDII